MLDTRPECPGCTPRSFFGLQQPGPPCRPPSTRNPPANPQRDRWAGLEAAARPESGAWCCRADSREARPWGSQACPHAQSETPTRIQRGRKGQQ